ncbi:MAG: NUMOD1 domain-containing DNA-binding protein, partial [Candidatus Dojkabacteria bacterium]
KSNNKLENLQWCGFSENSRHALEIGLNQTTIKMKTRDVVTGEVVIYNSASEMSKILGMGNVSSIAYTSKLPGYLYKRRYEIKYFDDDEPWFYEDPYQFSVGKNKSYYLITVLNKKTGEITKYNQVKDFYKAFKIRHPSGRLDKSIVEFKERYKDYDISYVTNFSKGPYTVYDIQTKSMTVFPSIKKSVEFMGKKESEIQIDLFRKRKFIYDKKWIIFPSKEKFVLEDYTDKPKPSIPVSIIRISDNSEIKANSIKSASRMTKIEFRTIMKYLNTGNPIKGLIFRTLE